jgi:hypothetical protein
MLSFQSLLTHPHGGFIREAHPPVEVAIPALAKLSSLCLGPAQRNHP